MEKAQEKTKDQKLHERKENQKTSPEITKQKMKTTETSKKSVSAQPYLKNEASNQTRAEKLPATSKLQAGKKGKEVTPNPKTGKQASDKKHLDVAKTGHQPKMKESPPGNDAKEYSKMIVISPESGSDISRKIVFNGNLENIHTASENVQQLTTVDLDCSAEDEKTAMIIETN
ncbi:unnamed protein product [Linum trigynum]|uniref:Uncharacterized protein n=1 Tax=Linum trigynum TaxID=586398 RepID=A0AAV2G4V5_9ROSI